jgi:hypothetical protein
MRINMVGIGQMLVALDLDSVTTLLGGWEVDITRRIRQGELIEIGRDFCSLDKARQY